MMDVMTGNHWREETALLDDRIIDSWEPREGRESGREGEREREKTALRDDRMGTKRERECVCLCVRERQEDND